MTAKTQRRKAAIPVALRVCAFWRLIVLLLFIAAPAFAEFRFPMPEFASGYTHPALDVPGPSNAMRGWDVVMLVSSLSLAAIFVLRRRQRREILLLSFACLLYLGFWRKGCVCPVGSIQNVVAGICRSDYGVPATVLVFFALPLVFALLFGRVFCASVCPLGAIQEAVAVRPVKVPMAVEKVLGIVPYVYLGLAVLSVAMGAGFLICQYDPFVGFFRMGAGFGMLLFGGLLLVLGVFVARPYCRFLCPYGVLLRWASKLSRRYAVITPSVCIRCDLCADSCPYNAIREPTPEKAPESRARGARRLGLLLLLVPLLVALGAGVGALLKDPLSRLHPTVRLAERVAGEDLGRYGTATTIDSEVFRASDQPVAQLYAEALAIKRRFGIGGMWLGAFVGLVVAGRLVSVSVVRRQDGYEPDRGTCFSCGRCFKYCPVKE